MKKIIALMSILILLLTGCQQKVNKKLLDNLKETYPEATIEVKNDKIFVYSDSDLSDVEVPKETGDYFVTEYPPYYNTPEEALSQMNLINGLIFAGKKTSESKQCIVYDSTYGLERYYTETKIKVTHVFYGDAEVGDEIVYREQYALMTTKRSNRVYREFRGHKPISQEECLYVVDLSENDSMFNMPVYTDLHTLRDPFYLGVFYEFGADTKNNTMENRFFVKYFIERDTALYESEELEKASEWKRKELTKRETAKIKELVKRYNDMAKQ